MADGRSNSPSLGRASPRLTWLADVLTALACTGLRISELAALRWSDVDLKKNVIQMTDESTRAPRRNRCKVRQIKNRRSRSFPIHTDLKVLLRRLPKQEGGLVFRSPAGGALKPDTVRRILIEYVLEPLADRFPTPEDEFGFAHGRLHSFRHSFCSRCANSGVPERVVMQWLGHRSSRMVRRYYHLHDDEAQREMSKLKFVKRVSSNDEKPQIDPYDGLPRPSKQLALTDSTGLEDRRTVLKTASNPPQTGE